MSLQDLLRNIEAEIDQAFSNNEISRLPFAQAAWTLLSVVEDHHFKIAVYSPLDKDKASIYVDGLINSLTHPLRVCFDRSPREVKEIRRELVDEHYSLANEWISSAEDYNHFCTIFPLYHSRQIDLYVQGKELIPSDWSKQDLSFEVYDRFVGRRDEELTCSVEPELFIGELKAAMRLSGGTYSVDFSRKLMKQLHAAFDKYLSSRHMLPEDWAFSKFSLLEYRKIFICLQAMAHAWFVARQIAAASGAPGLAFVSALWTPQRGLLVSLIAKYTNISKPIVDEVVRYLTFGEVGVRNPDIAIQPIVDLTNGQCAISPFLFINVNAERNLCVLLNQIPSERKIYSKLVDSKEGEVREETINSLSGMGFDFRWGRISDTDIDLAIIDRQSKVCMCVEIKWFIEPAEIREVISRSEELAKGVVQAKKIAASFQGNDSSIMSLLGLDSDYEFMSVVGSVNFIGHHAIQEKDVPIIKVWHLASQIRKMGGLFPVMAWLKSGAYLPRKDVDYKVREVAISCGEWSSKWYGIDYA